MKSSYKLVTLALLLTTIETNAQQIDVSADIRMRYEYRHGYTSLFSDTLKPGNFVAQRTRLNIDYSSPHLKLRLAPQNVRVWGDVPTTSKNDLNNAWHQAWAEVILNKHISIKAGRQELDYDNSRILGNLDWAMQARSHDAAVVKIMPNEDNTIHAGGALNANQETSTAQNYTVPGIYKAMQYLWYHGQYNNFGLSLLAFNQANPYMDQSKQLIAWNQTFGPRLTYAKDRINADATAYMQTGKIEKNNLAAYYFSGNLNYKLSSAWISGAGFEFLSGKAGNETSSSIKNFIPWYGTTHKFNGYMDYFYATNINNPTGLTDIYLNVGYETQKLKVRLMPHYFATAATLYKAGEKVDNYLGTEIDLTASYQVYDHVAIHGGYSQMFATQSMEMLKGNSSSVVNNWAFITLELNPKLFSHKFPAAK